MTKGSNIVGDVFDGPIAQILDGSGDPIGFAFELVDGGWIACDLEYKRLTDQTFTTPVEAGEWVRVHAVASKAATDR